MCLGASHRTTSFDLLDRLTSGLADVPDAVHADGQVVLSTCNRYELYLDVDELDPQAEDLVPALARSAGIDPDELAPAVRVITGDRVSAHLFAVTSGLDSMVFGEREIAGQVRRALARSRESGTVTPPLERLFQGATATSREVRAISGISEGGQSVVQLALDLAASRVADWRAARVVVVGSGAHARALVAALVQRGVRAVEAHSPSGRVLPHPAVTMVDGAAYRAALGTADLVLTATTAPVLTAGLLSTSRRAATGTTLVVDLGLPANVETTVADVPGVELLDLPTISRHAPVPELQASVHAHELVESAAGAFEASAAAGPVVTAFRTHVQRLLDAELERVRGRVADPAVQEQTERALRHFAGVLVHGPTTRAHALAAEGRLAEIVHALDVLYGVGPEEADADSSGTAADVVVPDCPEHAVRTDGVTTA